MSAGEGSHRHTSRRYLVALPVLLALWRATRNDYTGAVVAGAVASVALMALSASSDKQGYRRRFIWALSAILLVIFAWQMVRVVVDR